MAVARPSPVAQPPSSPSSSSASAAAAEEDTEEVRRWKEKRQQEEEAAAAAAKDKPKRKIKDTMGGSKKSKSEPVTEPFDRPDRAQLRVGMEVQYKRGKGKNLLKGTITGASRIILTNILIKL